jgi:hypothetical protein
LRPVEVDWRIAALLRSFAAVLPPTSNRSVSSFGSSRST